MRSRMRSQLRGPARLGIVVGALTWLVSGCGSKPGVKGAACEQTSDCVEGLDCVEGVCAAASTPESAEPSAYCQTLTDLVGDWRFDTTVVGAETLSSRGINGHYLLTVAGEGCEATVSLTTTATSYTPTSALANGSYVWTVQATDVAGNTSDFLPPQGFAIEAEAVEFKVYLPVVVKGD